MPSNPVESTRKLWVCSDVVLDLFPFEFRGQFPQTVSDLVNDIEPMLPVAYRFVSLSHLARLFLDAFSGPIQRLAIEDDVEGGAEEP